MPQGKDYSAQAASTIKMNMVKRQNLFKNIMTYFNLDFFSFATQVSSLDKRDGQYLLEVEQEVLRDAEKPITDVFALGGLYF